MGLLLDGLGEGGRVNFLSCLVLCFTKILKKNLWFFFESCVPFWKPCLPVSWLTRGLSDVMTGGRRMCICMQCSQFSCGFSWRHGNRQSVPAMPSPATLKISSYRDNPSHPAFPSLIFDIPYTASHHLPSRDRCPTRCDPRPVSCKSPRQIFSVWPSNLHTFSCLVIYQPPANHPNVICSMVLFIVVQ
jgi:hypothetical protein